MSMKVLHVHETKPGGTHCMVLKSRMHSFHPLTFTISLRPVLMTILVSGQSQLCRLEVVTRAMYNI